MAQWKRLGEAMVLEAITEVVELEVTETASQMAAYIARPDAVRRRPSVIVCGEIFGMTRHIRSVADRTAKEGYLSIALDFITGLIQRHP